MPPTRRPGVLLPFLPCLAIILCMCIAGCGSGGTPIAPQPLFSPAPGAYSASQQITITDPSRDAAIYYTTDGTLPTTSSTRYTGPILIASTTTLEVTAAIRGYRNSPAIAATYTIAPQQTVATPTFTPPAGAYSAPQVVALQDTTPNAQIFFTTDGSTPTPASTLYNTPVPVASSEVLKAIATAPNFVPSPVATASYTISLPPAATPTFTPPPGNYSGTQTIQITDSTPNATIFYTTDGSTPTPSSTLYTGALTVNSTETIQAIASAPNFSPGPVAVGTYTFAPPTVATPTFNPPAGNYTVAQSVQILDATPAAQIFYSTDGSVPSMASIQYTGPIPVTSTERINAIAYANPYTASPVATALYNILPPVASNPGQWTWMSGSPNPNDPGSYGTLGAASPSNTPPARYLANGVADQSGGLWLFGGINQFSPANETTASNDLWRFDTTTLEWTWINGSDQAAPVGSYGTQGVASPANQPPPRGASALWIDTTGNLWIFGGLGNKYFDVFEYGDLWEFSPTSGLWTWVGGSNTADSAGTYGTLGVSSPSNIPGAREGAVSCSDAQGNFWLFGGFTNSPNSVGLGSLNDLWRYSPVTHEWTWMGGSSTVNQPGSYGTIGVSSAGNMPGARSGAVCWSGPDGNLWIFGGEGQVTSTSSMSLNDLWNFNPVTLQWTWISGSNLGDPPAVYGTQGTPAASNTPSGRISSAAWVSQGALWLFGGETGNPSAPQVTGDLWRFDVATSQWTWVAGSSSPNEAADYGNLRASSPSTTPGARDGMTPWPDANGVLWLFGGSPSTTGGGMLNDLWRYHP